MRRTDRGTKGSGIEPILSDSAIDDEEQSRRARLTLTVVRLIIAGIGLVVLLSLAESGNPIHVTAATYAPIVAILMVCAYLARRGHTRAAGWLVTASFWFFVTGILWLFGGLHDQTATAYIIAVMIAGGTLGSTAAMVVAVASAAAAGIIGILDTMGHLPPPMVPMSVWNAWISVTVSMSMAAILLRISMQSLEEARQRARSNERQLRHAEARNAARARFGQAVGALGARVLEENDPGRFSQELCDTVRGVLKVESVAVLAAPESGKVCVLASAGRELASSSFDVAPREWADRLPLVGEPVEAPVAGDGLLAALAPDQCDTSLCARIPAASGDSGVLCAFAAAHAFDDEEVIFLATAAGLLGAALDRDESSRRFLQAQKMEVVGRLAGGVVHDFNNLLTVMTSVASSLRKTAGDDPDTLQLLDDLDSASDRASLMTGQLLAFSRTRVDAPQNVDLSLVVARLLPVIQRLIGVDYQIREELVDTPAVVAVDRAALEQAVLNLAVNARDAMPSGGTVTFRSGRSAGPEHARVWLSVSDSGDGLDEAQRERIFEPFFTTKRGGTGLGLATVRDIVSRADGEVSVESRPGHGTTFRLEFPEVATPAAGEAEGSEPAASPGRGRILLVEDDDLVRRTMKRTLCDGGYDVTEASDGVEALARLAEGVGYAAILSDLNMPHMGGLDLAARIEERGLSIPIVFASGRADAPPERARSGLPTHFVQKPFTASDLLNAIHECIDEQRGD